MGKMKQKKKSNYITRTRAIRYLRVSLTQFRYLCIINGIYPCVPDKQAKGRNKIYYHRKDIKYLKKGPVLQYLDDNKISMRHIKQALREGDTDRADTLRSISPKLPIVQILKDRYVFF